MNRTLKYTGAPSMEELKKSPGFPKEKDFLKGPIAVLECIEEIPCNPCETACPHKAITVGKPITNLPRIDFDKCTGCGICSTVCPGLAIYIKDYTYSSEKALISFPYEFIPLPTEGEKIVLVNRNGEEICDGKVLKINHGKNNNNTTMISAAYSKKYFYDVITMKIKTEDKKEQA